jgi:hypothetical protein
MVASLGDVDMVDEVEEDGWPGAIEAGWDDLFAQHYGSAVRLAGLCSVIPWRRSQSEPSQV